MFFLAVEPITTGDDKDSSLYQVNEFGKNKLKKRNNYFIFIYKTRPSTNFNVVCFTVLNFEVGGKTNVANG